MHNENDIFEYPVLTDQEIEAQRAVLEKGEYDFEIVKAQKKISEKGNTMIELQLKIWDNQGKTHTLFDWLVATPNMAFKVKHFWESVGEPEKYQGKTLVHEFVGKTGRVNTTVKKDKNGNDRPNVQDYVSLNKTIGDKPEFDDKIPY